MGHDKSTYIMAGERVANEVDQDKILPVAMEDLSDEQKEMVAKKMEEY